MSIGRSRRLALAALVIVLVGIGAALAITGLRYTDGTDSVPPAPGTTAPPSTRLNSQPEPLNTPSTLSLDPVGARAAIVDATVPDGVLTPPNNVLDVGIWLDGAPLDSPTGTTLIVGHVNLVGQGNGALFNLSMIEPGEVIRTSDATGVTTAWKVTAVTTRPKVDGVEDSVLAGPYGPRKLAVVTCGGELDVEDGVGNYTDNVYLYADAMN